MRQILEQKWLSKKKKSMPEITLPDSWKGKVSIPTNPSWVNADIVITNFKALIGWL